MARKKYIVVVMLVLMLFPTVSYAKCCDCCKKVAKKLLTVTEIASTEKFHLTLGIADKYCVRCGKKLRYILNGNYCGSCKTEFNIKEE